MQMVVFLMVFAAIVIWACCNVSGRDDDWNGRND